MCLRTASFFLYRLYLWAGKGSLFPGIICLFKYQKTFSEASPDHFPHISFIRTKSQADPQSAPGYGMGHLIGSHQTEFISRAGRRVIRASPESLSPGREKWGGGGSTNNASDKGFWWILPLMCHFLTICFMLPPF